MLYIDLDIDSYTIHFVFWKDSIIISATGKNFEKFVVAAV